MGRLNRSSGLAGEKAAAEYLLRHGYSILEKNYRTPWGEIDLIAKQEDCLCFIEVKNRRQGVYGHPLEAVSALKQKRITRAAQAYLSEKFISQEPSCRFEVIGIDENGEITHIKDAFQA
ncbi:MAG: YraN family protein [candidate division FCPU426 bacterium]